MEDIKKVDLGQASPTTNINKGHVPSTVQADTLFSFTSSVEYLIETIENGMISPRYCVEDLGYLKIRSLKRIAYPMKCFCDINLHKLSDHLSWYGYYGIAFSKAWGMEKKIQPVQYINPKSELCKDFAAAFSTALSCPADEKATVQNKMKDYMLHQLMYYKPYSGFFENRVTRKRRKKCFTDECEWRFIPDVTKEGFDQVCIDKTRIDSGVLVKMSNAMSGLAKVSLSFDYKDVKYVIVKDISDFHKLTRAITDIGLDDVKEHELISKIIVWDVSKGDF